MPTENERTIIATAVNYNGEAQYIAVTPPLNTEELERLESDGLLNRQNAELKNTGEEPFTTIRVGYNTEQMQRTTAIIVYTLRLMRHAGVHHIRRPVCEEDSSFSELFYPDEAVLIY